MQFLLICFSVCCIFSATSLSALEAEIAADFEKLKGQKNRAILLLQHYTNDLQFSPVSSAKERTAQKIAAILGEGKGVGGFNKTRKATPEEKKIMVRALDLAYQYYSLQDKDFFAVTSADPEIKKHQAILWGLSKTMGIKAVQKMYEKEREANREIDIVANTKSKPDERSRKLGTLDKQLRGLKNIRRIGSVQLCGRFDQVQKRYKELGIDKDALKRIVLSLLEEAGLTGYDSAIKVSENLFDLMDSKSLFVQNVLDTTQNAFSLNVTRHAMYMRSFFKVVNIHQYNPFTGSTSVAVRRVGGVSKFSAAVLQKAIAGLSSVDYDIAVGNPYFRVDEEERGPYLLRPHCWTDPKGGNRFRDVNTGIFESKGITINNQGADTLGVHRVHTHDGVASPNNMPLNLPQRNLFPEELYSFISFVKKGRKGVVTLHAMGGDFINEDIASLGKLVWGITAGDLFLLMHYCPVLDEHFLKLLVEWLG